MVGSADHPTERFCKIPRNAPRFTIKLETSCSPEKTANLTEIEETLLADW